MPGRLHLGLDRLARIFLHAGLVAPALGLAGNLPVATAVCQILLSAAGLCWVLGMARRGEFEWRRTSLEVPIAALLVLVTVQLVLGNTALVGWALAPPGTAAAAGTSLPTPLFTVGTIAPGATWSSLRLLLTYLAVYVLTVNLFSRRRHVEALLRTVTVAGATLAAVGLLDYVGRETGVIDRGEAPRRVVATFANPDHFGAWLSLVVFLGIGQLLAHGTRPPRAPALTTLSLSEKLEALGRRYASILTLTVMVLALVFTVSRGAILSLIVALAAVVLINAAIGRARRTVAAIGVMLVLTLACAVWLGLDPLLARLNVSDMKSRWDIWIATLPMLRDFPLLGTGLGTYYEISPRYQPPSLQPGVFLVNQAHNDWLQLWVELGPLGLVVAVWAVLRVTRDLVGAHLVGRGRCHVGGGEREWARRNDPFSVGIAIGAVGGVVALLVHSFVDFPARVPAVGTLAAAALGLATVSLHTRFGTHDGLLSSRLTCGMSPGRATAAGALAVAATIVAALVVARPAVVDVLVNVGERTATAGLLDAAAVVEPSNVRVLLMRARSGHERALTWWRSGALTPGQPVAPVEDRRREATALMNDVVTVLRAAVAQTPTSPTVHDRLGWAHWTMATIDTAHTSLHTRQALSHLQRAVALHPENPSQYEELARLVAYAYPEVPIEVGLRAASAVIQRRADRLDQLVFEFLLFALTESQWLEIVPPTVSHRVLLADRLEHRGLHREAIGIYRQAATIAPAADVPLVQWLLARTLIGQGDVVGALRALGTAARADDSNPEVFLATAEALDRTRDAAALDMYRVALGKAEERARHGHTTDASFRLYPPPLADVVLRRMGEPLGTPPIRYRRALARHLADRELWQQAMNEASAVLSELPKDPAMYFIRGNVFEALQHFDDAVEAYRKAVELSPSETRFRTRLARVLAETGQPNQAINEWSVVLTAEPNNLDAALSLARGYDRAGRKAEAMHAYEVVLRMAPDSAEARRALSRFGWIPR